MVKISKKAEKEFRKFSELHSLRRDMEMIASSKYRPFLIDGKVDVDAYIEFVTQFNEFINHTPKPFKKIIDGDMRL